MANTCGLFIGLQWRGFFSWRPNYVFVIAPFHYFSVALLKENVLIFSVWKVWYVDSGMGSSEHYRQSSPSGYGPGQDGIFIFPKTNTWAGLRMMWTSGRLCQGVTESHLGSWPVSRCVPLPSCWVTPCASVSPSVGHDRGLTSVVWTHVLVMSIPLPEFRHL